ncbi:MSCRAMM family protein [Bifidobacterium biavatii]|uniref:Cna protein B-type domain protein n=1 Tax=Bifidobacterium biavatii DSM 23969 TaxID=1437608 RepID=A0A087A5B5_9BIFI|nr:prealbumin-like fold domain-containing protein [Bifidobacterium biavatii]KFI53965.1 Cna protein B-type domain protein [Bifidobacterium biavatii DSM 23969]
MDGNGTLAYSDGGKVVIVNGTFSMNLAKEGGVIWQTGQSSSLTILNGSFDKNAALVDGGVIHNLNGSLTIDDGSFTNNIARGDYGEISNTEKMMGRGGVAYTEGGAASVSGGTFQDNISMGVGGGALANNQSGTLTVTGGTFTDNRQSYGTFNVTDHSFTALDCSSDGPSSKHSCRRGNGRGGGAIMSQSSKSTLTIQGKVTFTGNFTREWAFNNGGGAVYAKGILWVKNSMNGDRPTFEHNWAGVLETQYDSQNRTPVGGAGGAIFLQDGNSTGYLMGGEFHYNSSGYLGGAVYTEQHSTTYIAKAAATANIAGHFGGGFWLCPSGTGVASKGGNIALYDNKTNPLIDANADNTNLENLRLHYATYGADLTNQAGADFAIMNPYSKDNEVTDNSFQLMDTWFTDRTSSAVTWAWDNVPIMQASGFGDSWQGGSPDSPEAIIATPKTVSLTQPNGSEVSFADHLYTLQLSYPYHRTDGKEDTAKPNGKYQSGLQYATGVALKATVTGDDAAQKQKKAGAWSAASVRFSDNQARLSGGAFGTNGDVMFSTPYTVSWSKVANNAAGQPDESKPLAGSQWKITSTPLTADKTVTNSVGKSVMLKQGTVGGPYSAAYWPMFCDTGDEASYNAGKCWQKNDDGSVSAIVTDNEANSHTAQGDTYTYTGAFDNNPSAGGFDLNNLADGVYTMTEIKAPVGYAPETNADGTAKTYTFTIAQAQARWNDAAGNPGSTDLTVGNTVMPGVAWDKQDADGKTDIAGTQWTITKLDGEDVGNAWTIDDCKSEAACSYDDGTTVQDYDSHVGGFRVNNLPAGTYSLKEANTPDGYWHSLAEYRFTITPGSSGAVYPTTKAGKATNGIITNQKPTVSWSKVAVDDQTNLLSGTEWEISGGPTGQPTAKVVDCVSTDDATNACSKNTTNTVNDKDEVTEYRDLANASGVIRISGLPRPAEGQTYTFTLKETKAPSGYVLANIAYTFTIGYDENMDVHIDIQTGDDSKLAVIHPNNTGNLIPNVRMVAALPFTGGWDDRDWLWFGGAFVAAAALVLALSNEYRRRRAVIV